MSEFDPEAHERDVQAAYEKLFKYDAFDRLIDRAIDGEISVDEAISRYTRDGAVGGSPAENPAR